MSLEVAINENTQAIRELIAALAKGVTPTPAQVEAVAIEGKANKAAKEAAKEAAKAVAAPTQVEAPAEDKEPFGVTGYSYQDAAAAITKLSRLKGRDAAVALLYKFKASNLKEVQPDQFAEIIEAANAAMGE